MSPITATVDQSGVTMQFWMYPIKLDNENDVVLFSVQGYIDIVLTNAGNNLRVDLYGSNNKVQQSVVFTKYRFRFSFWTLHSISITET
jgi:hypothetical protein